jgi:hypothetical protein
MNPALVKFPVTFPTLAWQVIEWIESYLCHGPGDIQGDTIRLDLEECAWLCWAYRVQPQFLPDSTEPNPEAGRRLVHRAVYCRSKGMRKSEVAGMVCCAEALGPVRCDGFDARGEPVGIPVTYPFVRIMATEEDQSSNVYDNVAYMMQNGEVANAYHVDLGRSVQSSTRIYIKEPGGGEIVPSTSGDASKDGGKESFVASDEEHLMVSKKLRNMYQTVARNTGKRHAADPWIAGFSTAWQPGESSVIEQTAEKYAEMDYEEAVIKHGVLFDHKQGEPPKIFGRDDSLIKALKTAYAPYKDSWTDFNKIVRLIRDAEDPESDAYRYYLGIPRAGASTWLHPGEVEAVLGEVVPIEGESITVGFDGSESDDHTVLMGCRESGDLFTIGTWAPSHGDLFWRDDVNSAVEWTFNTFRVVRFYGDPPYWISEMAAWARDHGSPPITEWWTNRDSPMAVATGALRTAIRRENPAERVVIDPVPIRTPELFVATNEVTDTPTGMTLVRWHFTNARTRKVKVKFDDRTEEAFVVRKERGGSPLKIDAVPSAVLARRARDDALKENEFHEPEYGVAAWQ